jgi:hypothetical protein
LYKNVAGDKGATVFVEEEHEQRIVGFRTLLVPHVLQEKMPDDKPGIKREIRTVLLVTVFVLISKRVMRRPSPIIITTKGTAFNMS